MDDHFDPIKWMQIGVQMEKNAQKLKEAIGQVDALIDKTRELGLELLGNSNTQDTEVGQSCLTQELTRKRVGL